MVDFFEKVLLLKLNILPKNIEEIPLKSLRKN